MVIKPAEHCFSLICAKSRHKTLFSSFVLLIPKVYSLQENQRYQGNISCKDGLNTGQIWYGPNRS